MSDKKEGHHSHGDPKGGSNHSDGTPYWKRAHRTWTFWLAVFLMLAAMVLYAMTDGLAGWHHAQPPQPIMAP